VGIITFTIIADLLDALILHYSAGFTRYGFLAFVLSAAVMLARLYGKAQRERLFVSATTVAFHVTGIFKKFGIDGKTGGRSAFLAEFVQK
jgi:hypothetical protein